MATEEPEVTTCPQCRSGDLVQVELRMQTDQLRFALCRACEQRWWTVVPLEVRLELPDLLSRVAGG